MRSPHLLADHAASAPAPKGAPRPWWEGRPFVVAMVLLAFVPLIYPAFPPLVDIPGHMGRYAVAAGLPDAAALARHYSFQWKPIGNLGVDLLVVPLAKLMGVEAATKAVVMMIPPLTVAGFLWVAREVHNRLPPTAAFALPFAFAHPFLYGFVNFALAMALALLAFALWMRLYRARLLLLRGLIFVPLSFLLFFCHTFGWGTLGLLAFSGEAVREHDRGLKWWKAGISAALHALILAGPMLLLLLWRTEATGGLTFGWFRWKMKWRYFMASLRDRWEWFDQGLLLLILSMVVLALVHRRLTLSRNLVFSALVLLAGYICIPYTVFGSAYADMRLIPYALALFVLSIRFADATEPVLARRLALAGLGTALVATAATTASLAIAARDQQEKLGALAHIRPGSAVVAFARLGCRNEWPLPRDAHLMSLATVRNSAFANDQWRMTGSNLLSLHLPRAGYFLADPSQHVQVPGCRPREAQTLATKVKRLPPGVFDYLWVIDLDGQPGVPADYKVIWRSPGSILYEAPGRPTGAAAQQSVNHDETVDRRALLQ